MPGESAFVGAATWRNELPLLTGRAVAAARAGVAGSRPLVDLLSLGDATRFGLDEPVSEVGVQELIERFARERASRTRRSPT